MNELIVKLAADRLAWLMVTALTLLAALVFIMPGVDDYCALRSERNELTEKLLAADRTAQQVQVYEAQMAGQADKLDALRSQTLREASVADFRNELVKLVRESGCQLRRLNISEPQRRPWRETDSPFNPAADTKPATPFQLETRIVSLALGGPLAQVRDLLDKIQTTEQFAHAKSIDLRPAGANRRQVELNVELWFYAIERQPTA